MKYDQTLNCWYLTSWVVMNTLVRQRWSNLWKSLSKLRMGLVWIRHALESPTVIPTKQNTVKYIRSVI